MNRLVVANTKKAMTALLAGPPPFDEQVELIARETGESLDNLFRKQSLTPFPIFFRSGAEVMCAQDRFFGFYLLCQAIRACLASVNFQIAGEVAIESELFGPAVALFYTSAYHSLQGFLAINGRVFIDTFAWIPAAASASSTVACVTKGNKWKYEERARGHVKRWLELKDLFGRRGFEVPQYFRQLFSALFPGLKKKGLTIMDVIRDPNGSRATLEEHVDPFLRRIADVRHTALYRSYGEDPHVVEALVNGETTSASGLGRQAEAVGDFAHSLLAETARAVRELMAPILIDQALLPSNVRLEVEQNELVSRSAQFSLGPVRLESA